MNRRFRRIDTFHDVRDDYSREHRTVRTIDIYQDLIAPVTYIVRTFHTGDATAEAHYQSQLRNVSVKNASRHFMDDTYRHYDHDPLATLINEAYREMEHHLIKELSQSHNPQGASNVPDPS